MKLSRRFILNFFKNKENPIETAIAWAKAIAANDNIGYDQLGRNDTYNYITENNIKLNEISSITEKISVDCSSYMSLIWSKANPNLPYYQENGNGCWTTFHMVDTKSGWQNHNFERINFYEYDSNNPDYDKINTLKDNLIRGDVVVYHYFGDTTDEKLGHTFMYLGAEQPEENDKIEAKDTIEGVLMTSFGTITAKTYQIVIFRYKN